MLHINDLTFRIEGKIILDAATGNQVRTVGPHAGSIRAIAFSSCLTFPGHEREPSAETNSLLRDTPSSSKR